MKKEIADYPSSIIWNGINYGIFKIKCVIDGENSDQPKCCKKINGTIEMITDVISEIGYQRSHWEWLQFVESAENCGWSFTKEKALDGSAPR